jgi:hypothetical protein
VWPRPLVSADTQDSTSGAPSLPSAPLLQTSSQQLSLSHRHRAQHFCKTQGLRKPQATRVLRAIDGISEAYLAGSVLEAPSTLWSVKTGIFDDADIAAPRIQRLNNARKNINAGISTKTKNPKGISDQAEFGPRIKRVDQGKQKISNRISQYEIAGHLAHVLYAHNIDELARRQKLGVHSIYSAAAYQTSQKASQVRDNYNKSNCYKFLLKKDGPGMLLLLGAGVNNLYE